MSSVASGSFPLVILLLCTEDPLCTLAAEEGAGKERRKGEEEGWEEGGRRVGGGWEEGGSRVEMTIHLYSRDVHDVILT